MLQNEEIFDRVLGLLSNVRCDEDWKDSSFNVAVETMELKSEVLLHDPWENKGLGYILLYGHFHAHSLERATSFKLSHGLAVYIGIMIDLLLANKSKIQTRINGAFRAAKLNADIEIKEFLAQYREVDFSARLRKAYEVDPKPHHHGSKEEFSYLKLSSIGVFKDKDNAYLANSLNYAKYSDVLNAIETVFEQLA